MPKIAYDSGDRVRLYGGAGYMALAGDVDLDETAEIEPETVAELRCEALLIDKHAQLRIAIPEGDYSEKALNAAAETLRKALKLDSFTLDFISSEKRPKQAPPWDA